MFGRDKCSATHFFCQNGRTFGVAEHLSLTNQHSKVQCPSDCVHHVINKSLVISIDVSQLQTEVGKANFKVMSSAKQSYEATKLTRFFKRVSGPSEKLIPIDSL